jgi:hypothetical protein
MTPILTALDPAIFSADVLMFAAERGVTDHLGPLYELTRRCFPGVEIAVTQQDDYEFADMGWIVFEPSVGEWDLARYRAAKDKWIGEFLGAVPPADRQPFILGMR